MAIMPQSVQDLFTSVPTVVFSTASTDGQPNTCMVGMKFVLDPETVYLSDQFFKKTLANVQENTKVAVAFWEGHDAFQIYGTAAYINDGAQFDELKAKVDGIFAQMGMPMKAKGGILVHVDAVYNSAPGAEAGNKII
jgi:hypothetical protein